MKKFLLASLLSLAGLFFPAELHAQFIGYVTPQTVAQKVLNAQTAPVTAVVPNLGQTVHALTYTAASCTGVDIRLEGSEDGVNFFAISTDATDTAPNPVGGVTGTGGVTAVGYFPVVRVNLVAVFGGGCSVTAFYAGTSTISPSPTLIYQQASVYRYPVTLNTTTSSAFITIELPTPFGNSQGSIWLQCSAACASGGAVTVFASPSDTGLASKQIFSSAVATVGTLQRFDVPAYSTNRVFVSLTPTAASANTWAVYYNFAAFPQATPSASITNGTVLNGNNGAGFGALACENFTPINTTANVQLLSSGGLQQKFHICSIQLVVSGADNVALVEGTGATCGTGTAGVFGGATAATGWNLAANGQISLGSGFGQVGQTAINANNLCLLVSGVAQVSGGFTWTQF